MKKLLLVTAACVLVAASAVSAQRMGHSNTNAPEISQTINMAGKAAMKITYTSITWANGTWSKALADASQRDKMRERINAAADESPLGLFETDVATMVGGQHVAKGVYKLSFGLNESFQWEMRLHGATTVSVPLKLTRSTKERKRLTVNLNSGSEDASGSLHIVFGNEECDIPFLPHFEKKPGEKLRTTINQQCPLMDEAVDPAIMVSHKGQLVGLCCDDCIEDWKKLSTKERDEHLEKVVKKK